MQIKLEILLDNVDELERVTSALNGAQAPRFSATSVAKAEAEAKVEMTKPTEQPVVADISPVESDFGQFKASVTKLMAERKIASAQIKNYLGQFGVSRLSDIPTEKRNDFLKLVSEGK